MERNSGKNELLHLLSESKSSPHLTSEVGLRILLFKFPSNKRLHATVELAPF